MLEPELEDLFPESPPFVLSPPLLLSPLEIINLLEELGMGLAPVLSLLSLSLLLLL